MGYSSIYSPIHAYALHRTPLPLPLPPRTSMSFPHQTKRSSNGARGRGAATTSAMPCRDAHMAGKMILSNQKLCLSIEKQKMLTFALRRFTQAAVFIFNIIALLPIPVVRVGST